MSFIEDDIMAFAFKSVQKHQPKQNQSQQQS